MDVYILLIAVIMTLIVVFSIIFNFLHFSSEIKLIHKRLDGSDNDSKNNIGKFISAIEEDMESQLHDTEERLNKRFDKLEESIKQGNKKTAKSS